MLPNIGYWHPQVVHFVVALLVVGVLARVVSLMVRGERWAFVGPAATTLVLLGTLASVLAVKSGTDAHGPVERIPGARDAVVEHEEWGERVRNVFLVVAALELAGLALGSRPARRWVLVGSGLIGLGGLAVLYEAAEHGGELVYKYAGGVGIRYGDSTDVGRLLVAGLYQQAMQDRAAKRPEAAAQWLELLAARFPGDPAVQLLRAESLVLDRKDGRGALALLAQIAVPQDNPLLASRRELIKADAYLAAGLPDSARATLEALSARFPNNQRIKQRLEQLKGR
jgi:uncharacterized membrane protein